MKNIIETFIDHDQSDSGAVLITPNRRLARYFARCYEEAMLAKGFEAWASPKILSWQDWLLTIWEGQQLAHLIAKPDEPPLPQLLNPMTSQLIWQQIIQTEDTVLALIQPVATANSLAKAHQLLQDWQCLEQEDAWCTTPEANC